MHTAILTQNAQLPEKKDLDWRPPKPPKPEPPQVGLDELPGQGGCDE